MDSNREEWRPVVGFEGIYSVSSLGRVRHDIASNCYPPGHVLKPWRLPYGHLAVSLTHAPTNRWRRTGVHVLVAEAFLGPRPSRYDVNHIDGVKTNNAASNLEYITHRENARHASRLGLLQSGERHWRAAVSDADMREACRLYATGRFTQKELAERFGVGRRAVGRWIRGERRGDEGTCQAFDHRRKQYRARRDSLRGPR